MKRLLFAFTFLPLFSYAQVIGPFDNDWNFRLTANGSMSNGETFESIGVATFSNLENLLATRGGFAAAYRDFRDENHFTYGVWQEAEAFRQHLKDCDIDVPADLLAMRIGLDRVFNSQNDVEVEEIFTDLGNHLTFEKKIELASRMGGMLLQGYDNARADGGPNSDGVVSLREMIEARRNDVPSGVCRDMSQAIAASLKQMGVDQVYVVAYQTAGGGHATVIAQDPDNAQKTYNINYNYQTTTESGSALSHLQQDSTIPSVGTEMRIYNAEGKQLTALPTHLGVALNEITGRNARNITPMLSSENYVGAAQARISDNLVVGAGVASTPDNDEIIGTHATFEEQDGNFPMRMSVVLYRNQRETNLRGDLTSYGAMLEGEQRIVSNPISVSRGNSALSMNVEGRVNFNMNMSRSELSASSSGPAMSGSRDLTTSAAIHSTYKTNDGSTRATARLEATGGLASPDVRDSDAMSFDLRQVTGTVYVSQRLRDNLEGFATGIVTARPEFGSQSRQELGVLRRNNDGSITSFVVGNEGQMSGEAPVFIPGSRERVTLDARYEANAYAVSGGVFCRESNTGFRDCGAQASATIKLGGRSR